MYRPALFREDRPKVLQALIRNHPLATLVTAGPRGLMANHIPFLLEATDAGNGILRAHLARANDQLAELHAGTEALVIFQGPDSYVTPSWYASKVEHGKVVPTWNYATVHAWGTPIVHDDPVWLRDQIGALTVSQEQRRAAPWAVEDAPEEFVAAQIRAIVGVEIPIARIEGKWKVSQNRPEQDRRSVVAGLSQDGDDVMAGLVAERGKAT
ncbi:MAG: FMN-binding negative transcriptional regulator [Xanthobacteraceae bacterium]|nr:FMN-binding negative transcriptional regulator [Xanthobacteraceae bacterium]